MLLFVDDDTVFKALKITLMAFIKIKKIFLLAGVCNHHSNHLKIILCGQI
jgi:hypothetical protein